VTDANAPTADEELLTVPEAAAQSRLHPTTIVRLCHSGHIGAYRVGNGRGRWRIPAAKLEAYNAARTPQAA
jgi:excisionase family DNA binding protein